MPEDSEITELVRDIKEQIFSLQELGVKEWNASLDEFHVSQQSPVSAARPERFIPDEVPIAKPRTVASSQTPGRSRLASLPTLSKKISEARETAETSPATAPKIT